MRFCSKWWLALVAGVALLPGICRAGDGPAELEFFELKIRPLLIDNCYKCHGQESTKVKGGLSIESREGLLKGGNSGPAIVPGDPDQSLLIRAVRYQDEKLQMPPKGKKLSPEKVADLETWVKMGAPDPRMSKPGTISGTNAIWGKAQTHWAFQKITEPLPPVVKQSDWIQTPVDNFILAKLESLKLQPTPAGDRRTLIRRLYFDLLGLPPTAEQVSAFVTDKSPEAYAKLVDELLASPRYGERWGRHWLDVARYADTKGYVFEEERRYPYSYTYRDYVIRAFNEDLPFDRFLKEQIAADLLPVSEDKRSLAALGFLTLGRRFINNIHDIIDDRIDVVCRGTMGLTMGCARCHDHKYDPFSARDYYALYGVFDSSTEPGEEPLLGTKPEQKLYDEFLAERGKRQKEARDFREESERKTATDLRRKAGEYLLAAFQASKLPDQSKVDELARKHKLDPGVTRRWMSGLETWSKGTNAIFKVWFAFAALREAEFAAKSGLVVADLSGTNAVLGTINARVVRAFAGASPTNLDEVAGIYGRLFKGIDEEWMTATAVTNAVVPTALPEAAAESVRQILYAADAPANVPHHEFDRLFDVATSQKIRALQRKLVELDATHLGAPARAMAMIDKTDPHNVHVFLRGSPDNRGPEAPRRFPEIFSAVSGKPFQKGSGRLELAEAITSRENPLTARVLVNRVWLQHFGSGLVNTPSDFGLRSDPPTHPELLDYLSARFMTEGWSIKKLHRLILLSSTYQQGSQDNQANAKIDPGNQWIWRMNRQRLDFEALRDSLLQISGRLDLKPGGQAVNIIDEPSVPRRSVYGYIDRQNLPALFRAFDFASPDTSSARRFYTTVPQQALFLLNSPFLIEQARAVVDSTAFKAIGSESAKLKYLYGRVLQREPTSEESRLAGEFLHAKAPPMLQPAKPDWFYGYGMFDTNAQRVTEFNPFPYGTTEVEQGGASLPDTKLGWVMLTGAGGHPGSDQHHAAIRRWIAPRDGHLSIRGSLEHAAAEGDGVRGRIVSSRSGELGKWVVHHDKKETRINQVEVKAGDTLDFVTDCIENEGFDSFNWSPKVRFLAEGDLPAQRMEWNAQTDFADKVKSEPKHLEVWQKYAQVLLLTNELVFVD